MNPNFKIHFNVLSVHNFGPQFLEDTVKEKVFLEKLTILSLALPHNFFLRQKKTPCLQNKEWKLKKVCIRPFLKIQNIFFFES